jgi:ZIP family zinc transporter
VWVLHCNSFFDHLQPLGLSMENTLIIILYSSAAGLPIIIGGLISAGFQKRALKVKEGINHWVIALGGGALLSAIAFALVPTGLEQLPIFKLGIFFLSGTIFFMLIDVWIDRMSGSMAQVVSMMLDFIPEALALGASFAHSPGFGMIMALFIGLQNLPEGFNAYLELNKRMSSISTLLLMLALSFVGIISALLGQYFLSEAPATVASILIFAAGGILYLVFQDIAPLSKRQKDWIAATGASVGFLLGMVGEKLLR